MNTDYLYLVAVGLFGAIILMILPDNAWEEAHASLKIKIFALYSMVVLGILGLVLFILDIF